jgi:hypothetical protein
MDFDERSNVIIYYFVGWWFGLVGCHKSFVGWALITCCWRCLPLVYCSFTLFIQLNLIISRGVYIYIYQRLKICTLVEDPCFGISCYVQTIMLMLYVHKNNTSHKIRYLGGTHKLNQHWVLIWSNIKAMFIFSLIACLPIQDVSRGKHILGTFWALLNAYLGPMIDIRFHYRPKMCMIGFKMCMGRIIWIFFEKTVDQPPRIGKEKK